MRSPLRCVARPTSRAKAKARRDARGSKRQGRTSGGEGGNAGQGVSAGPGRPRFGAHGDRGAEPRAGSCLQAGSSARGRLWGTRRPRWRVRGQACLGGRFNEVGGLGHFQGGRVGFKGAGLARGCPAWRGKRQGLVRTDTPVSGSSSSAQARQRRGGTGSSQRGSCRWWALSKSSAVSSSLAGPGGRAVVSRAAISRTQLALLGRSTFSRAACAQAHL